MWGGSWPPCWLAQPPGTTAGGDRQLSGGTPFRCIFDIYACTHLKCVVGPDRVNAYKVQNQILVTQALYHGAHAFGLVSSLVTLPIYFLDQ